uniref:Neuropeptide-Like Protein n=1 Tax=Panagrellus redivivus TaxID=6233 RepID=A0A7E4UNQ2_PANRE
MMCRILILLCLIGSLYAASVTFSAADLSTAANSAVPPAVAPRDKRDIFDFLHDTRKMANYGARDVIDFIKDW